MARVQQYKLQLIDLIKKMKLNPTSSSLCVFDVEAGTSGWSYRIIFDLSYGFVDISKPESRSPSTKSFLVYESIKDADVMKSMENWGKLKDVQMGHAYDFYNILKDNGWWTEDEGWDMQSSQDIDKMISDLKYQQAEKVLERQRQYFEIKSQKSLKYWRTRNTANDPSSYASNRIAFHTRARQVSKQSIKAIETFLSTDKKMVEIIDKLGLEPGKTGEIKKLFFRQMYEDQKKHLYTETKFKTDDAYFKMLKITGNIQPWDRILGEWKSDLDAKVASGELLAVSSYNISQDRDFISRTSNLFSKNERFKRDFLEEYGELCAMNFSRLVANNDVMSIMTGVVGLDSLGVEQVLSQALKKTNLGSGKNGSYSLEVMYEALLNKDFTPSHVAEEDTTRTIELLHRVIQKNIVDIING